MKDEQENSKSSLLVIFISGGKECISFPSIPQKSNPNHKVRTKKIAEGLINPVRLCGREGVVENIKITSDQSGIKTLPNAKAIEIISMDTPIMGTMEVAEITLSGISKRDKLDILFGSSGTVVKNINDSDIANILWVTPEIN